MSLTECDTVLFIETYKPLHTKEWNMRKLGMSLREFDSSLHRDIHASSHQGMEHEEAWMSLRESDSSLHRDIHASSHQGMEHEVAWMSLREADTVLFIETYKPLHTKEWNMRKLGCPLQNVTRLSS